MHVPSTEFLVWAAGFILEIFLLVVLVTRHRATTFPIFTTLIAFNIVRAVVLYPLAMRGTNRHSYYVVYFAFAILDFVLQSAITYELASHVFRPTGIWAPDVRKAFLILTVASFAVAVALACIPSPPEKTLLGMLLDRGNLFSSALQCELFIGMIALSATARLPWKTHVARIAQGLGFYSLIGLLLDASQNVLVRNTFSFQAVEYIRNATYLLCESYWIVMLWQNAPAPQELPEEIRIQLFTLQRRVEYDLRKLRALKR
jgi:hypothetical protein